MYWTANNPFIIVNNTPKYPVDMKFNKRGNRVMNSTYRTRLMGEQKVNGGKKCRYFYIQN